MTNLRKAAEMALEALENAPIEYDFHGNPMDAEFGKQLDAAITALRQALAQGEQENEAYGYAKRLAQAIWEKHYKEESPDWKPKNDVLGVLTQIDNMTCGLEKAQPEQEPVAWMHPDGKNYKGFKSPLTTFMVNGWTPLYTAPPSKPDVNQELVEALEGLDEAYCRAGSPLNKQERHEDRMRLIVARRVIAKHKEQA